MNPHWIISDKTSTLFYEFPGELFNSLKEVLEEYIWGIEEEENVVVPGLHRQMTQCSQDYTVYKETYIPSQYPPMVIQQPDHDFDYVDMLSQFVLAAVGTLFPRIPAALRTRPLGRKASLVIGRARICRLFGDLWRLAGGLAPVLLEMVIEVLYRYILPAILLLMIVYIICRLKIFTHISKLEDIIRLNYKKWIVECLRKLARCGKSCVIFGKNCAIFMALLPLRTIRMIGRGLRVMALYSWYLAGICLRALGAFTWHMAGFPKRYYKWVRHGLYGYLFKHYVILMRMNYRMKLSRWEKVGRMFTLTRLGLMSVGYEFWLVLVSDGEIWRPRVQYFVYVGED